MPKTSVNLPSGTAYRLIAACCLAAALVGCAKPPSAPRPEPDIMATAEGVRYEMRYFYGQDKTRLFRQSWLPSSAPKGALLVVHGLKEHGGLYANLGQELAKNGYAVVAMDLRGHGFSDGAPQQVESFNDYVVDLALVIRATRNQFPNAPVFLLGNDLGGTIATRFAQMIPDGVEGLALSAATTTIQESKYKVFALKALATITPNRSIAGLKISPLSGGVSDPLSGEQDPLVHAGGLPANTGREIMEATKALQSETQKLTGPILIMHGVADNATPLFGSIALFDDIPSEKKVLRQYPELGHNLWRDDNSAQVINDLKDWLDQRTQR